MHIRCFHDRIDRHGVACAHNTFQERKFCISVALVLLQDLAFLDVEFSSLFLERYSTSLSIAVTPVRVSWRH